MNALQEATAHYQPKWGRLSAPVDPEETRIRMRAQSVLSGGELGQCPPLDIRQARDVLAWYRPQY
ncbi:MAG TPA: hypothetical protein VFH59_04300 [Frateuria sp.]|uniref:hypothetical protein n=1 Tax=Frateuria sp. TaxID=2211372 RepID=UPI002D801383|nr:hypothetical protein [Frateuria sp.]HET6804648.1 hypothetical protein [Frateuria sp.]